jgi:hypothetical protein
MPERFIGTAALRDFGAGKLPKVVIVAVMRKMITTLNAMVRDDVAWADRFSGRHSVTTAR